MELEKEDKLLWTRIIPITEEGLSKIESHLISRDMEDLYDYRPPKRIPKKHASKIYFEPKAFNQEHKPLLVEDYELDEPQLQEYGILVSELRTKIAVRGYQ
jgi:hypothetical protein